MQAHRAPTPKLCCSVSQAHRAPTTKSSAAVFHSHQRLKKGSHKKLLLSHIISYCNQQLFNPKGTRSNNKVLMIASGITNPAIISGETEAHGGRELLMATQRASGCSPSSSTNSLCCDPPSRLCCLTPGKHKEQVCNSTSYRTINTVQGCGDTIIIHRSETKAIYVCVDNRCWEMCLQSCSEISCPLYFEQMHTVLKTKYSLHVAVLIWCFLIFQMQFFSFPSLPLISSLPSKSFFHSCSPGTTGAASQQICPYGNSAESFCLGEPVA